MARVQFDLCLTKDDLQAMITKAYRLQVENLQGKFLSDSPTNSHIAKVAEWLATQDHKPSLLICGGVGNGKTTLLNAIEQAVDIYMDCIKKVSGSVTDKEQRKQFLRIEECMEKPIFVGALQVVGMSEYELSDAKQTDLLLIDDLGTEPSTIKDYGTTKTPMIELLYKRYDYRLPTIMTTNYRLSDIESIYNARIADRFKEMCDVLVFENGSYRGK